MSDANLTVEWIDRGREPQVKPNPEFPNGVDLDISKGKAVTCQTALPYPARRCGYYVVSCSLCDLRVCLATAGRPDDPRSIKVACKRQAGKLV
jgi:hypothetical protein